MHSSIWENDHPTFFWSFSIEYVRLNLIESVWINFNIILPKNYTYHSKFPVVISASDILLIQQQFTIHLQNTPTHNTHTIQ